MENRELIEKWFLKLESDMKAVRIKRGSLPGISKAILRIEYNDWQRWATSFLNLLQPVFGESSVHFINFKGIYDKFNFYPEQFEEAKGIFLSAKSDFEGGYLFDLQSKITGELFGDFVALSKTSLKEGYMEVAAVLACAALEDALKRYARSQDLSVDDEVMQTVVSALKTKGLVSGAQKTLLDAMPKIRDYAMHANWNKIKPEDVSSVIGFVERFLLDHF